MLPRSGKIASLLPGQLRFHLAYVAPVDAGKVAKPQSGAIPLQLLVCPCCRQVKPTAPIYRINEPIKAQSCLREIYIIWLNTSVIWPKQREGVGMRRIILHNSNTSSKTSL